MDGTVGSTFAKLAVKKPEGTGVTKAVWGIAIDFAVTAPTSGGDCF